MNKHTKLKTRTLEEYALVMTLRNKTKKGQITLSKLTGISKHTIHDWIYLGVKPKRLRKTKFLPEGAKRLTPELAYVLGVLKGDGCLCKNKRHSLRGECFDYVLTLGVTDEDFAEYYKEQLEKWSRFIAYAHIRPPRGKGTKPVFTIRLRSKDIYEFLNGFDINKLKLSSSTIKAMFLRGLYDSEGHVSKFRENKNGLIHIGMADFKTVVLAKELLSLLNIHSGKLLERTLNTGTRFYYFHIGSLEGLRKFRDNVGFSIRRKQERLNDLIYR